ncbi:MAG: TIGR00725 family protein, partial [Firmicutes bacterium]|nr:TIGR00725 family protein [Bacillota bacterium]
IVLNSRILVAIGGEMGTLAEIALALKYDIPVVALKSWQLEQISRRDLMLFHPVDNVDQCLQKVMELLQ